MLLACVTSVSVRFRSKERGTKVKMAQAKERPKPRIPFLGLSFLRNQTETIATRAGYDAFFGEFFYMLPELEDIQVNCGF